MGLLVGATDPARKLSDVFNRLQRAAAASDRIYQMLDREPAIRNLPGPSRCRGTIARWCSAT